MCDMMVPGWVWKRPGSRARVILWPVFTQKQPKTSDPNQPTVTATTQPNIGAMTTHAYSIHHSAHAKHEERVFFYICVRGGVPGSGRGGVMS